MEYLSDELKKAIENLYWWQYGDGTNFTSRLYDLMCKADKMNRSKLEKGFPDEYAAWKL